MKQWYALFTRANSENQVAATLQGQGLEVFLPQMRTVSQGSASFRVEALFPCYLFICVNLESLPPQSWQWTPGLRYMVQFAGEPAVVPADLIDTLRKEIAKRNESRPVEAQPFQQGDVVRVVRGPMADLLAVFEGMVHGATRSRILVDFLGRVCHARVDLNDLEKVPAQKGQSFQRLPRRSRGQGRPIINETVRGR